jgi:hypothetical protein
VSIAVRERALQRVQQDVRSVGLNHPGCTAEVLHGQHASFVAFSTFKRARTAATVRGLVALAFFRAGPTGVRTQLKRSQQRLVAGVDATRTKPRGRATKICTVQVETHAAAEFICDRLVQASLGTIRTCLSALATLLYAAG